MRSKFSQSLSKALLVTLLLALPVVGQSHRVEMSKRATPIPTACELVVPASIEGTVDIAGLMKEAYCKGSGDMMSEYSYVMTSVTRQLNNQGKTKEQSTTYEVFIPTLKIGTHAQGILVVTSRNGVPVPPKELEKARTEAGERLEKAEAKIAHGAPAPETNTSVKGMLALGMYTHTTSNRSPFGGKHGSAALGIHTYLKTCDLTLARREQHEGRETLVFTFVPRPDAKYSDNEAYIAKLTGEIWIDAKDRIVTRLAGWPSSSSSKPNPASPSRASGERPPAVYVEMMLLPEGVWLPRVIRINGADYQKLFDGITDDTTSTFSKYIRFSTEINDVKVGAPGNP